jgi:hypothetical protein
MSASLLEELWDQEMHVIYADGIKHCGYRATYFLQMVSELGSLQTARILLKKRTFPMASQYSTCVAALT